MIDMGAGDERRMTRCSARAALAAGFLALAVTGCGGSSDASGGVPEPGGSGGTSSVPAGPVAETTGATGPYVLAEGSSTTLTKDRDTTFQTTLYVFDRTRTGVERTVDLGISAGVYNLSSWRTSSFTVDREARKRTYNGDALLLYVQGGRVWKVDLLESASRVPTQVSSIANACRLGPPASIKADGSIAWLAVGVDEGRGCTSAGTGVLSGVPSATSHFVRTDMGSSAPAIAVAGTARILTVLDDGASNALGLLVRVGDELTYVDRQMNRLGAVPGATSFVADPVPVAYDHATLQAMFFDIGSGQQRLTWTDRSAAFDPPVAGASAGARWLLQPDADYRVDGTQLLKRTGNAAAVLLATLPSSAILVRGSRDYLVVQHGGTASTPYGSISVIRKSDGFVRTIADSFSVGTSDDAQIYTEIGPGGSRSFIASLDGARSTPIPASMNPVWSRLEVAGERRLEGAIACVSATSAPCASGRLVQFDMAGHPIDLGPLNRATPTVQFDATTSFTGSWDLVDVDGGAFSGLPSIGRLRAQLPVDASGTRRHVTDFVSFVPGVASSLTSMTTAIP